MSHPASIQTLKSPGTGRVYARPFKPYIEPSTPRINQPLSNLGVSDSYLSTRGIRTVKRVQVWQRVIENSRAVIAAAKASINQTNGYLKGARALVALSIHKTETTPMFEEIKRQRREIKRAMGNIRVELEVLHDDDSKAVIPLVYPSTPIDKANGVLSQVIEKTPVFNIGGVSDEGYDYEGSLKKRQKLSVDDPRNKRKK